MIGAGLREQAAQGVGHRRRDPAHHFLGMALGAPAKPVRELTDEEKDGLRASAERYRENMRHFRETLEEV